MDLCAIILLFLEYESVGQFLPFSLVGHLDVAALPLFEGKEGGALKGEGGCENLAAIFVDELNGGLCLGFHLGAGDEPAERVVTLAKIAG